MYTQTQSTSTNVHGGRESPSYPSAIIVPQTRELNPHVPPPQPGDGHIDPLPGDGMVGNKDISLQPYCYNINSWEVDIFVCNIN